MRTAGLLQALMLLLPITLSVMGIVVLLPVLPAIAAHFAGIPGVAFWAPALLTIPSLIVVLFAPVAGLLSDVFGRRRLLIGAMLIYTAAGMAPFVFDTLPQMLASRIAVGLCEAVVMTTSTTMIGDYFKGPERDKWLGYQTGIASLTSTVLIFFSGVLGHWFGWHGSFLIYGSALLLMVGIIAFTWEPKPDMAVGEHGGAASWRGFPWKRMAGICALTLFSSYLFYLVQVELSFALALKGVAAAFASGTLQSLVSIGVPIGTVIFRYSTRLPTPTLLCIEYGIVGVSLVLMGIAPTSSTMIAASFVNQIGAGMLLPTMLTTAMRLLPFEHRGRGTGIWDRHVCGWPVPPVGQLSPSVEIDGRPAAQFRRHGGRGARGYGHRAGRNNAAARQPITRLSTAGCGHYGAGSPADAV